MPSESNIYLGRHKIWGVTYLSKHSWDCGWYWGFGYVGNANCHWHIQSIIKHPEKYESEWTSIDHHFSETWLNQHQWWILRDLFFMAYALKEAAAAYHYGGHQTSAAAPYRVTDPEMVTRLNADLGKVLDNIWNLLNEWKENAYTTRNF